MSRRVIEDVSRETSQRLEHFEALLRKWNPKINLVAPSTLDDLWGRHFLDSFQTARAISNPVDHWVDLGSGAGFPGLIVAIHGAETGVVRNVTLVESDRRKATFLSTVNRELSLSVRVVAERIETTNPLNADVVSARALAPLPKLLGYCQRHLKPGGQCILPKGAQWEREVEAARSDYAFDLEVRPSKTQEGGATLIIQGLASV